MTFMYEKYKNIQLFIHKYRKYTCEETFYELDEFSKLLQIEQYIKHICFNPITERYVYIFLFY